MLTVVILLLLGWLVKQASGAWGRRKQNAPYPPGPRPKPLIGNMFDFPLANAHEVYMQWAEKYKSDILYVNALGYQIVILNKLEDADELFERRARKYSDRPVTPIMKLLGWSFNSANLRYGDEWRWHRKVYQQHFRLTATEKYYPLQLQKVHRMLKGLLETPEKFEEHNKVLSISIPMYITYGYEIESIDDPCISAADKSVNLSGPLLLPGANFIDIFPVLAYVPTWFPGASSRKMAAKVHEYLDEMQRIPLDSVKKRISEGTAVPSIVSDFLEKKANFGASEQEEKVIVDVANTFYGAGSDTTISATSTFFYLMTIHPDIQKKAHEELDRVIGSDRLPDFGDRSSLPYIDAIYREVMRWRPPIVAIPHCSIEDDYYKGCFIPKGTTVLGNIWAMTRDPEVYQAPYEFKPERFIDHNGNLNDDSRILAYGFGRRACAGKHIASSTLWLIIASVLASFKIEKAKDELGNEIPIDGQYEELGLLSHKAPFKCSFKPRSAMSVELIAEAT